MTELNSLKPKQIKETDFDVYLNLDIEKYPDYYKYRYLLIKKYKNNITFFEVFDNGNTYEEYQLSLDSIKWLLDKRRIKRTTKVKLIIKLAENE